MNGTAREATTRPRGRALAGGLMVPGLAFATAAIVATEFIVVGLLPVLARDLAVTLEQAGWLVSALALSAALAGPAVTLLVSRWRPRPVLVSCLALFGLSSLAAALFPSYPAMMAARAVQGALLTHIISLASAEAAALAGGDKAGRAIGQVNLGAVVGMVLMVPAGVALAALFGWRAVFAGLGGLALASAGLVRATMPDARPTSPPSLAGQVDLLRRPRFLAHLALSALLFTAMFAAYSYIAAFLEDAVGLPARDVAPTLLGFGIAGLAGNWLTSRMVDRDPTAVTLVVAGVLVATVAAVTGVSESRAAALALLAVWGAAHTAAFVACQVRVMFAAPGAQAFAASLNISVCNLGIALGAALGGWVVTHLGIEWVGLGSIAAGLAALAVGGVLRASRPG